MATEAAAAEFTLTHFKELAPRRDAPAPAGGRRARILVVDDESAVAGLLAEFLGELQYDVVIAEGGRQALDRLASDPADAVILDVQMPGMDGMETLRQIRAADVYPPVLMMTGNDDLAVAQQTLALGAFDHILKPIDFDYLARALVKMLEARSSSASGASAPGAGFSRTASVEELACELALDVVRLARTLPPAVRTPLGPAFEQVALAIVQRGPMTMGAAERTDLLRHVDALRALLRFAKELGDIDDEAHRRLESLIFRTRSAMGLG